MPCRCSQQELETFLDSEDELESDPFGLLEELESEADERLTPNFKLSEFRQRDGTPVPARYRDNVRRLARNLQVLRSDLGRAVRVTSGYRSPAYNRRIKGAPKSQHLFAKAADIRVSGMKPAQVYCAIERLISTGTMRQGGLGIYRKHVHYDIRGKRARWTGEGVARPSCTGRGTTAPPPPPRPRSVGVDPKQDVAISVLPLPPSLLPDLTKAIKRFTELLLAPQRYGHTLSSKRARRLKCYLRALLNPKVDDRVIFWLKICGLPDQALSITSCSTATENGLRRHIRSKGDVERANAAGVLGGFIWHLRPIVLSLNSPGFSDKYALEYLDWMDMNITATITGLSSQRARLQSAMPRHYVAIKDWIRDRQADPDSVYACRHA